MGSYSVGEHPDFRGFWVGRRKQLLRRFFAFPHLLSRRSPHRFLAGRRLAFRTLGLGCSFFKGGYTAPQVKHLFGYFGSGAVYFLH